MSIELKQAAQQALEALQGGTGSTRSWHLAMEAAIEALRTAIQQAESEPVAWVEHHKGGDNLVWDDPGGRKSALYTHPAPGVPDDVVRDAISTVREQYRGTDWGKVAECVCDAIDDSMTAAQAQKGD